MIKIIIERQDIKAAIEDYQAVSTYYIIRDVFNLLIVLGYNPDEAISNMKFFIRQYEKNKDTKYEA